MEGRKSLLSIEKLRMAGKGGRQPGAGRPKGSLNRAKKEHVETLSDLARRHTADALQVLIEIAKHGESEAARVSAACAILDRGYGKPSQSHEHAGPGGEGPIAVEIIRYAEG